MASWQLQIDIVQRWSAREQIFMQMRKLDMTSFMCFFVGDLIDNCEIEQLVLF